MGLWGLVKTAATNIPWSRVAQSTPLLVEVFGKARDRFRQVEGSQRNVEEHLKMLQEENAKLSDAVLQLSANLQRLNSRVTLLAWVSVISLLAAIAALVLAIVR